MQRAPFPDALASPERPGFRKFGLVGGADSFELYGGPRPWKRHRCFKCVGPAPAPAGLCRLGNDGGVGGLHPGVWNSAARGMDASCFSSALGAPAPAQCPAFRRLVFDSAFSHNSHGIDASRFVGRSAIETPGVWPRHWFPLWRQHSRRHGRRAPGRNLSGPAVRTLGNRLDRRWGWAARRPPWLGCLPRPSRSRPGKIDCDCVSAFRWNRHRPGGCSWSRWGPARFSLASK